MVMVIRPVDRPEYDVPERFMYESVYQPDPSDPYPRNIIYLPEIRIYWDGWGKENDHCLVAVVDGSVIGAVWTRTFDAGQEYRGFGYIDGRTPEIAIALLEGYRNKGTGTLLVDQMLRLLREKGFEQVSLSISKGNPAIRLYGRLGFTVVKETQEDFVMLLKLE